MRQPKDLAWATTASASFRPRGFLRPLAVAEALLLLLHSAVFNCIHVLRDVLNLVSGPWNGNGKAS